jgi:hypothetical protein
MANKPNTIVVHDAKVMATIVAQLAIEGVVFNVENVNKADGCWEIELTGGH